MGKINKMQPDFQNAVPNKNQDEFLALEDKKRKSMGEKRGKKRKILVARDENLERVPLYSEAEKKLFEQLLVEQGYVLNRPREIGIVELFGEEESLDLEY